jgi:hypothetical protein
VDRHRCLKQHYRTSGGHNPMTDEHQSRWKLQCNNKKCRRVFEIAEGEFRSNTGIRCPHCGKSSQYRAADFIRENCPKEEGE